MRLQKVEEIALVPETEEPFYPGENTNLENHLTYAARSVLSAEIDTADYYDFIPDGHGNLGLIIADVYGKGLPARLLRHRLRLYLQLQEKSVLDDICKLAFKAHEFYYHSSWPSEFASLFVGRYDGRSGRLNYVNCAQVPPLLVRPDGSSQELGFTAPVLGVSENWTAASADVYLKPGDTLVMVTDGITEATDWSGQQFGSSRLLEVVRASLPRKPVDIASEIVKTVNRFSASIGNDDVTALVARVNTSDQPGPKF